MNKYDLAYITVLPFVAPVIAWRILKHHKYKKSIPGMFYLWKDRLTNLPNSSTIWIHAVSVGEISGAKALIPHLRSNYPNYQIVLTVTTETGFEIAKPLEGCIVDFVQYFPFDLSANVREFISLFKPEIYIGLETELWPNLFLELSRYGTHIFILNGRISKKALKKYQYVSFLFKRILKPIMAIGVQTEADANNIASLLGDNGNIVVTGNIKLDIIPTMYSDDEISEFREVCHIRRDSKIVSWGSTHDGEEAIAIDIIKKSEAFDNEKAVMIIVPRHPERFQMVYSLLKDAGLTVVRYSDKTVTEGTINRKVILIDAMGLLNKVYAISDIGVVAGSFIDNIGGHNILEPATYGIPVIYGENMWGQVDMLRILNGFGGIMCSTNNLQNTLSELLTNDEKRALIGEQARNAVENNRGAVIRSIRIIQKFVHCS